MKVMYVYTDYMKRRKLYGHMISELGHEVVYFSAKKKDIDSFTPRDIKKTNPDVLWLLNPFYVKNNKHAIEYARDKNIPIIVYGTYNPQVSYKSWDIWDKIDFLFVHNLDLHKYLKDKGLNSFYMPLGFYPDQYNKCISNKSYNISFCGGMSCENFDKSMDHRLKMLQSLSNIKNAIVYGDSFKNVLKGIPVKSFSTHSEQRDIYSKTKINLDLPFFSNVDEFYKNKIHIKNRFFEIPATGNFLLTCRCEEFLRIFPEDTVGYYDFNTESLLEESNRYIKDKKLRQKKAKKAYKIVHNEHTFKHRFRKIWDILDRCI